MQYFKDIKTESELKARFRVLAKENHPDKGGSLEVMKIINSEYDILIKKILSGKSFFGESLIDELKIDKELREKIQSISGLDNLIIELCGSWIWVTGDTKQSKDFLKSQGFKWAKKKCSWYFHVGQYKKVCKRKYSLCEIRKIHGSFKVSSNQKKYLTA